MKTVLCCHSVMFLLWNQYCCMWCVYIYSLFITILLWYANLMNIELNVSILANLMATLSSAEFLLISSLCIVSKRLGVFTSVIYKKRIPGPSPFNCFLDVVSISWTSLGEQSCLRCHHITLLSLFGCLVLWFPVLRWRFILMCHVLVSTSSHCLSCAHPCLIS